MHVIVLGAGVVGTSSAWYLHQAGHGVTVIDRQPDAALETSFANGGQISVSHAEPWAGPGTLRQVLAWLGREESPLLWRLRLDAEQWRWGLQFLAQCTQRRADANTRALIRLGLHSRAMLQTLRAEVPLDYDQLVRGILRIYTSARDLEHASAFNDLYAALGCRRETKTAAECLAVEPALRESAVPIVGGLFAPDDESGDACKFTQRLAAHCVARGVTFRFDATVAALRAEGDRIDAVVLTNGESLRADAFVISAGSYAPRLLRPLGLRVPIYPAKGYSLSIPIAANEAAPTVSLTDEEHRIVFSRLGDTLRVAGTAEFAGYDTTLTPARCEAIAKRVRMLFPGLSQIDSATRWAGLRPATPGNVPLIGRSRYRNLYLNGGHGTLGWTLACGSGQLLADVIDGRETAIDPAPYRP